MDIMEMVKQVVASLTKDKNLLTSFVGDPAKIVKSILGGDLTDDIIGSLWGIMGYTVLLCFSLFKTGSLAKSVMSAH